MLAASVTDSLLWFYCYTFGLLINACLSKCFLHLISQAVWCWWDINKAKFNSSKLENLSFSQETQLSECSQNETEEKRDPWPPYAYRGVFLCSQNEALLISHSEEGRRVHKRGTEGGVECMSNRHIIPAGEHGQRIWGAARKGIKNKEANHEDAKTKKKNPRGVTQRKGELFTGLYPQCWGDCCLCKTWNNWLTVRVLWLDLKYCYLPKPT